MGTASPTAGPTSGPTDNPSEMPSIDISMMPSYDISMFPSIDISMMPSIDISMMPSIDISATPSIDISEMPSIDISDMPSIDISDMPSIDISDMPSFNRPPPCPKDLVLNVLEEVGTKYENIPLEITHQNATTVTLKIIKPFIDVKEFVYVEYMDEFQSQCVGYEEYEGISEATITAQCRSHHPVTIVNVFVSDDSIVNGNSEIPLCCHAPDVEYPVVKYSFKVYCVTKCTPEEFTEEIN